MTAPSPTAPLAEPVPSNICAQMVEAATSSCQPLIQVPPEPTNTTADSLAALSTAFTFGSILLAIIVLMAGFAWGKIVAASAEKEAKAAAKECAEDWMAKNGPRIVQSHVDLIVDATLGDGDDAKAADDIGKGA